MLVLGVGLFRPLSSSSADHACTKVQKWWKQGEEALPLEKKSVLHSQRCPQAHAMPAIYWTPWTVVISKPETTGSSSLWISCSFIRGKGGLRIPERRYQDPTSTAFAASENACCIVFRCFGHSTVVCCTGSYMLPCCHVAMLLISPFFARDLASFAHIKSLNKVADLSDVYITAIYNNSQLILILGSIACYNHESQRFLFHVASNCHMKGPSEAEGGSFLLQFLRLLGVKFSGSSLSAITWCLADPPACMPIHTNIYLSI